MSQEGNPQEVTSKPGFYANVRGFFLCEAQSFGC